MALTDAKRRANNKYIAKTMTVTGCKVRKEEADAFRSACKAGGTTPNAVFRRAMQDYMAARQETNGPGDNEGAGPMFREKTRDEDLAEFFGKVLAGDPNFRRRLLPAMSRLSEEQWAMLEEVAQRLVADMEEQKKDPGQ